MAEQTGEATIELYRLADDGVIPNNAALPLIVYRGALPPSGDVARQFETLFARNGWSGGWRNGIFPYHHYHSNAHEVARISSGQYRVPFCAANDEHGAVRHGDVVVGSPGMC